MADLQKAVVSCAFALPTTEYGDDSLGYVCVNSDARKSACNYNVNVNNVNANADTVQSTATATAASKTAEKGRSTSISVQTQACKYPMATLSTCTGVERPVYWSGALRDGCLRLLDQRELPAAFTLFSVETVTETIRAIKDMAVRGAPAIGAAGAFGLALAARASVATTP